MSELRAIIFSARNVLFDYDKGTYNRQITRDLVDFFVFCENKGIQCYIHSNDIWRMNSRGVEVNIADYLEKKSGVKIKYFNPSVFPSMPVKPNAAACHFILDLEGLAENEVIYIGGTDNDMRTAVNGKLLFLNACWYSGSLDYGFKFYSIRDVARFVDTCCLRKHFWFQSFSNYGLKYKSLSPYSTRVSEYRGYSESAKLVSKFNTGLIDFWLQLIISSIYFSGLYDEIEFICSYPGHKAGFGNPVMDECLDIFAKCFRIKYLPNLIVRHTTSEKSQTARIRKCPLTHESQLNTISINPSPKKGLYGTPFKGFAGKVKSRLLSGNPVRVLLIDDICTSGCSLEAGRIYLSAAGMDVTCLSWLKTINVGFEMIKSIDEDINPHAANFFSKDMIHTRCIDYRSMIVDSSAPREITESFKDFEDWEWPF